MYTSCIEPTSIINLEIRFKLILFVKNYSLGVVLIFPQR